MTKFIIAGNSHVAALRQGLERLAETATSGIETTSEPNTWTWGEDSVQVVALGSGRFELQEFSTSKGGKVSFIGRYAHAFRQQTGATHLDPAVVWAFVNVANGERVFRQPMWKVFAPSALAPTAGRTPLTEAVIRRMLENDHAPARAFYERIKEAGISAVAVEPPRPQSAHHALADDHDRSVALYLDALTREMWQDWLNARSIRYVEPPASSIGTDGFLKPELRRIGLNPQGKPDTNHGNAKFGSNYIQRIVGAMRAEIDMTRA
ncbi:hypothetical protein [Microbacterium sp. NPDC076895]|uniref:hypothetical protein n=1 Tax=Microbacterium sp. NPDC076895 TaxID=3154957 RepID=UPI0034291B45